MSVDPAPAIGLTHTGYPISSAATYASCLVRIRENRGTRSPAASTRCFMIGLSRNPIAACGPMPDTPSASRTRAASTTHGSHRHSTRSGAMRRAASTIRRVASSSSSRLGTCK